MVGLRIPAKLADIDAAWLERALKSSGAITIASVVSIEPEMIGQGQGFAAQLARLVIEYDREEPGAPPSIVAKLATENPEMRRVAQARHIYEREVLFYEQLAEQVTLRTPRCYFSALDEDSGDFVLLLEDLVPARVGDQVAGCSLDDAEIAIRSVAEFHAAWWEHPKMNDIRWLPSADRSADELQVMFKRAWRGFTRAAKDKLPDHFVELGSRFADNVAWVRRQSAAPPQTIVHGDYRLDNLFFESSDGGSFAAIDWQITHRNRGPYDLAWFMSGSLSIEMRRTHEKNLIDLYHSTLVNNGVTGYSLDDCTNDYRMGMFSCLMVAVIAAAAADATGERAESLLETMISRLAAAMYDLNVGELLPKG